jgi:CheY-like chemotaxis protein
MESPLVDLPLSRCHRTPRVLCAEDHPQMAALAEKILRKAGYQVVCVLDGREALDRLTHDTFDVVITDHHMPDIAGLELVTRLKELGFSGRVVVHTSRLTAVEEAEYRKLGVDSFLMKPGGILRLTAIVGTV